MIDEKKLLKHLSDWWLSETPSGDGTVIVINGELQKTPMMKTIEDFMETVEQQPKVGEWIPCSERLPEDFGLYLASYMDYTGYHVNLLIFDPKKHFDVVFWKEEIDAWMPLPEPYKEEGTGHKEE